MQKNALLTRSHLCSSGHAPALLERNWSHKYSRMDPSLLKQARLPLALFAFLLAFVVAVQCTSTENGPVANLTANKTLRGQWIQTFRKNRKIAAYVGIPYAHAPVGDLRFHRPEDPKNWTGELKLGAVGTEPLCPQLISGEVVGEEDCLKLSVYTPEKPSNLPILVWLHGGSFMRGGAKEFGPQLLLDRDVILVTVNYRLGALGFLSTEDEAVSGNWGLKDQLRAIQWIQEHAQAFGGDPKKVTVGGVGAGGVSAHLHAMSVLSRHLLYAVISMSGTALRPDIPTAKGVARRRALRMAERLGCESSNLTSVEAKGCLRSAKVEQILKADTEEGWAPVVEDYVDDIEVAFLDETPVTTLTNAMTHDLPWLTGFAKTDGRDRVPDLFTNFAAISKLEKDFNTTAGDLLGYASSAPDPAEVTAEIRDFYFDEGNVTAKGLEQMLLDAWYLAPADEAVRLHAAHSPAATFLYLFTGGSRKEQLGSLFPVSPKAKSDAVSDKATSELVLNLWTNFITKGVPTPEGSEVIWKKSESNDLEFMEIAEKGKLLQGKGLLGHRAYFWSSLPRSSRHANVLRGSIPLQSKTRTHVEL